MGWMVIWRHFLVSSVTEWHVAVLGCTMQDKDKVCVEKVRKVMQGTAWLKKNKIHFYVQISLILLLKILHISYIITHSYMMQELSISCECLLGIMKSFNDISYIKFWVFYLFECHALAWQRLQEKQSICHDFINCNQFNPTSSFHSILSDVFNQPSYINTIQSNKYLINTRRLICCLKNKVHK